MSHPEFFILAHLKTVYSEVHPLTILMNIHELSVSFYHIYNGEILQNRILKSNLKYVFIDFRGRGREREKH